MLRSVTFAGKLPPTRSFLGNLLRDVLHQNEAVRKEGAGGAENGECNPRCTGRPQASDGSGERYENGGFWRGLSKKKHQNHGPPDA